MRYTFRNTSTPLFHNLLKKETLMIRPVLILAGCVLCFAQFTFAQTYSSKTSSYSKSAPAYIDASAQHEVYQRNKSGFAALIRQDIQKSLTEKELDYLRKHMKKLNVFAHVNMEGKVIDAEVDYFNDVKISEKAKLAIANSVKKHVSYDLSPKAKAYFRSIKKDRLSFIYTLPVEFY